MFSASEIVKVQVESDSWAQLLPIAAIVISLASVAVTIWFRFSDRLRLDISTSWSALLDHDFNVNQADDRVNVIVRNASRTATTVVESLTVRMSDGKDMFYVPPPLLLQLDTALPATLAPGASATISFSSQALGDSLGSRRPEVKWLRPIARTGHGLRLGKRDRKLPADCVAYALEHAGEKRIVQ